MTERTAAKLEQVKALMADGKTLVESLKTVKLSSSSWARYGRKRTRRKSVEPKQIAFTVPDAAPNANVSFILFRGSVAEARSLMGELWR